MIIKPRKSQKMVKEPDTPPVKSVVVTAPESKKPQPKAKPVIKVEAKPVVETEKKVEEKIVEEVNIVSNKRSLLDEILEEQTALEN